eukprot:6749404-Prymnesium_polylepis.2
MHPKAPFEGLAQTTRAGSHAQPPLLSISHAGAQRVRGWSDRPRSAALHIGLYQGGIIRGPCTSVVYNTYLYL